MRKLFISVLALFVLLMVPAFLSVSVKAQGVVEVETIFFESLYDIPVMLGLIELKEQSMSFDKLEGRLAYATALGRNVSQQGVLTFYGQALPQMGWRQLTAASFVREEEKLEILYEKTNAYGEYDAVVKFSLGPLAQ